MLAGGDLIGASSWTVGRLFRVGVLVALAAVLAVGVTGFLRNNEILEAETAVRRSGEVLGRIEDLRAVVQAEPVAGDALRLRVAGLSDVAGADPVHRELLRRVSPPSGTQPGAGPRTGRDPAGQQAGQGQAGQGQAEGAGQAEAEGAAGVGSVPDVAGMRAAVEEMRRHEQARFDRGLRELGAVSRTNRWMIVWVSALAALAVLAGGGLLERRGTRTAGMARRVRSAPAQGPAEFAGPAAAGNEPPAAAGNEPPAAAGNEPPAAAGNEPPAAAGNEPPAAATREEVTGPAFLQAMRHEIRTPMTALTGMTAMLLETSLDARQRELAETAHASGSALLTVVDDLLDLADDLVLEKRPFSLRGCVRRAMEPVLATAEAKGLHLAGHLAPGCPERAGGDERRVRRILTALLRQAVAGTGHGAVTVTVSEVPDRGAAGSATTTIRFAVTDTGLGVPAERHADAGVLLARRLAGAMGGGITTESRPGEGTTVGVTLRLDEVEQPGRSGGPYADGRRRVLVVLVARADPVDRRLARRLLERRGHRVVTVADGEAAVEAVQRDRYDLVLMGAGLRVLDGPNAVRLIHADPPPHGSPRIVAMCPANDPELEDFGRAGVDGTLTEPVDGGELDVVLATAAAYADVRLAGAGPLPGPHDSEPDTIRACADVIAGPEAEAADRRRLAEILHNFADRLPGVLDRMDAAATDGDSRNLARLAHGLKASSATLGANRFAALCADLEDRARHAGDDPGPVLRDLHERAREVSDTMESVSRQLTRASR
ncbi:histidine kinase dimerization/phospho-acceptor domain-containing protein [Actinoplanes sp. NPDC049802]|uniref:histidine kinase dimerization/phospho-acceptor domain-containing protein n=1 Tax=Actinoplanes sp. NPDC049802 TaxID=3154742 RepID=UPI0033EE1691